MDQQYERLGVLGRGAYGVASLVKVKGPRGHDAPLRVIKETDLSQLPPDKRKEAQNEAEVLRSLSHVNIISYIATFLETNKLFIVMEYADGGDLAAAIKRRREAGGGGHFSERRVLSIFGQCALGLQHTHARHILHRDLKSQNIFLTKTGTVKLGDFGIAKTLDHTTAKAQTRVGTPYYIAPEVCDNMEYGLKADIWSLGVVLYEMFALEPPFKGESLMTLVLKIIQAAPKPLPDIYSREAQQIAKSILQKNPERRPTCDELVVLPAVRLALSSLPADAPHTAMRAPTPPAALREASPAPAAASPRRRPPSSVREAPPSPDRAAPPSSYVRGDPYGGCENERMPWDACGGLSEDPADAVEELLMLLATQPIQAEATLVKDVTPALVTETRERESREPRMPPRSTLQGRRPERPPSNKFHANSRDALSQGYAAGAECGGYAAVLTERAAAAGLRGRLRPEEQRPPRRQSPLLPPAAPEAAERLPSIPASQRSGSKSSDSSLRPSRAPSVERIGTAAAGLPFSRRPSSGDDEGAGAQEGLLPPPPPTSRCGREASGLGERPLQRRDGLRLAAEALCSGLATKLEELADATSPPAPLRPSLPAAPTSTSQDAESSPKGRRRRRGGRRRSPAGADCAKVVDLADGTVGLDTMVRLLTTDPCSPLSRMLAEEPSVAELRPRLARREASALLSSVAEIAKVPALKSDEPALSPLAEACRRGLCGGRPPTLLMNRVASEGGRGAWAGDLDKLDKPRTASSIPALRLRALGKVA